MMTVLLFLLVLGLAWSDDSYPIYVYPAALADTAPVLDGKLDEPVWQQAPVVSGFAVYGKPEEPAPVQTSVRVLYDRQNLCFGVRCEEPAMDRLSPVVHPRDEHAILTKWFSQYNIGVPFGSIPQTKYRLRASTVRIITGSR